VTSLYQVLLRDEVVETITPRRQRVRRWFYLDIARCLDDSADRDEAVVIVPENRRFTSDFGRVVDLDLSTRAHEIDHLMFPLSSVADWGHWLQTFVAHASGADDFSERFQLMTEFERRVIKNFTECLLPVIELSASTTKEAVCVGFEKVNTDGKPLDAFELITAMYTAVPSRSSAQRVQALSGSGRAGFIAAAKFLVNLGIYRVKDLPYQSQITPLAAILADLGSEADSPAALDKITRWYWNGVFGELYGSSTETRFARDFIEVVGGSAAETRPAPSMRRRSTPIVETMRMRLSAACKGVNALLMHEGAKDFRTGQQFHHTIFFDENVDIHHIFPPDWCKKQGIPRERYDSIINKTPLSARTNRIIADPESGALPAPRCGLSRSGCRGGGWPRPAAAPGPA